ncbi:hypothetical protein VTN02DRAFT_5956 [Thermoascus thermophilus]
MSTMDALGKDQQGRAAPRWSARVKAHGRTGRRPNTKHKSWSMVARGGRGDQGSALRRTVSRSEMRAAQHNPSDDNAARSRQPAAAQATRLQGCKAARLKSWPDHVSRVCSSSLFGQAPPAWGAVATASPLARDKGGRSR